MFEVEIEAEFSASHQLRLPDGTLEPLHGHNWPVTVAVAGPETDAMGCLVDFHALHDALADILATMDGSHLNEHEELGPANPSAEHVARHIGQSLAGGLPAGVRLLGVTVGEAPRCRATWRPG